MPSSLHRVIPFRTMNSAPTTAMAFDFAESRFLLCGTSRGGIFVCDFEDTGRKNHKIIPARQKLQHKFLVTCCQWYPIDSNLFATSGRDKELKIWDSNTMSLVDTYGFETSISQFHWGVGKNGLSSLFAVATNSSNVSLIDPRTGVSTQEIRCISEHINAVHWQNMASDFILVTGGHRLTFWDVRSGRSHLAQIRLAHVTEKASENSLVNIVGTSDGEYLASMTRDGRVRIFDTDNLKEIAHYKTESGSSKGRFDLAREGRSIFCFVPTENNLSVIRFNNLSRPSMSIKENIVTSYTLKGHFCSIVSCAYRTKYQNLVTSSNDRLILVWSPAADEICADHKKTIAEKLYEDEFSDDD